MSRRVFSNTLVDLLTKGGCDEVDCTVAFTPKGGCLLKPPVARYRRCRDLFGSIHPQGWVLVETTVRSETPSARAHSAVAFTPKGGCLLKPQLAKQFFDSLCLL